MLTLFLEQYLLQPCYQGPVGAQRPLSVAAAYVHPSLPVLAPTGSNPSPHPCLVLGQLRVGAWELGESWKWFSGSMQICADSCDASLPQRLLVPTRTWKGAELTAIPSTHFCALSSEKGRRSRAGLSEEAGFESA